MSNGSNIFGVSFAQIQWILRSLQNHPNVSEVVRTEDILFSLNRLSGDDISLVCLDEYACGLARVLETREAFPGVNIIYVGGMWNGYTTEAKEHCLDSHLGLYNTSELSGGLHRNDYWAYHKRDRDGNPIYSFNNITR